VQRSCEIEGESGSDPIAYKRCIESRWFRASVRRLSRRCEANRLITEGCQNFLMPHQAPPVRFKHQDRFANTATGDAGRMLNGYRLVG
jgi:hypothetical protein